MDPVVHASSFRNRHPCRLAEHSLEPIWPLEHPRSEAAHQKVAPFCYYLYYYFLRPRPLRLLRTVRYLFISLIAIVSKKGIQPFWEPPSADSRRIEDFNSNYSMSSSLFFGKRAGNGITKIDYHRYPARAMLFPVLVSSPLSCRDLLLYRSSNASGVFHGLCLDYEADLSDFDRYRLESCFGAYFGWRQIWLRGRNVLGF